MFRGRKPGRQADFCSGPKSVPANTELSCTDKFLDLIDCLHNVVLFQLFKKVVHVLATMSS